MTAKSEAEALSDYKEAHKKYKDKLDECYPGHLDFPWQEIKLGKILTPEASSELDWLADEVERKRKNWVEFKDKL